MFIIILGILDVIAGFLTFLETDIVTGVFFYFGCFMLLKGIYSMLTSAVKGWYLDFMGWIDLLAGITLLTVWNIPYIWVLVIIKGVYSAMFGFLFSK